MNTQRPTKKEFEQISSVAEILAMMDERKVGKEWLRQEIKKHKLKLAIKPTTNNYEVLKVCPTEFLIKLLHFLKGDELEDFGDVDTFTKMYHWFFTDIVAGSDPTMVTTEQVRKIVVLNELISRVDVFKNRDLESTVILPTGDGMAIGFSDSPEKPLRLAMDIHKLVNKYNESRRGKNKLLLRIGIDMGPVFVIKDLTGNDNVWGPGIIMARRVMDLAGDMHIFASERIANDIRTLSPEYKSIFHKIGNYSIKHGETLKLYNIYGEDFGSKQIMRKKKIVEKRKTENDFKGINTFTFKNIDIELEIKDIKTMLAHHTWIWNVVNISNEPRDQIFYYIDGDTPKDFPDMNVKVSEGDEKLEISSLTVNKPYRKEFNAIFKTPLKPRQRNRFIKLEYDWEEPERNFFYKLATDCKKFNYKITIPNNIELKNRVLKVDTEMGYKWHATPAPKIKYLSDKTVITWEGTNLKAYEAYKFEW